MFVPQGIVKLWPKTWRHCFFKISKLTFLGSQNWFSFITFLLIMAQKWVCGIFICILKAAKCIYFEWFSMCCSRNFESNPASKPKKLIFPQATLTQFLPYFFCPLGHINDSMSSKICCYVAFQCTLLDVCTSRYC